MNPSQLSALILTLVGIVAAIMAIPPSPLRKPMVAVFAVLIAAAVVLEIEGERRPQHTGRDTISSTDTPPATPSTRPPGPPVPARYARIPLGPDGSSVTAVLYFGRLDAVTNALADQVVFNTDSTFRPDHPALCVGTVVFSGVPGVGGSVFAQGLGAGWGAAENVPSQKVYGSSRTLHQQLVVPPDDTRPGRKWQAYAQLRATKRT